MKGGKDDDIATGEIITQVDVMDRTTAMADFPIYGEKFDTEDVTIRQGMSPTETKVKRKTAKY